MIIIFFLLDRRYLWALCLMVSTMDYTIGAILGSRGCYACDIQTLNAQMYNTDINSGYCSITHTRVSAWALAQVYTYTSCVDIFKLTPRTNRRSHTEDCRFRFELMCVLQFLTGQSNDRKAAPLCDFDLLRDLMLPFGVMFSCDPNISDQFLLNNYRVRFQLHTMRITLHSIWKYAWLGRQVDVWHDNESK